MATEMEKLKEVADRSYVEQRFKALIEYIDDLGDEAERMWVKRQRHQVLIALSFMMWMISLVADVYAGSLWSYANREIAFVFHLCIMGFEWFFIVPPMLMAIARQDACFKTLELLGMIDPIDSGRRRRLKKIRESRIAKLWEWLKQQQRRRAFV